MTQTASDLVVQLRDQTVAFSEFFEGFAISHVFDRLTIQIDTCLNTPMLNNSLSLRVLVTPSGLALYYVLRGLLADANSSGIGEGLLDTISRRAADIQIIVSKLQEMETT